jgi:hypothetical protein
LKRVALVLFYALVLMACDTGSKPENVANAESERSVVESKSIEYKFALVNAGENIPNTDPSVVRSRELLDRAAMEYSETPELIADMSYAASKLGKEEGVNVTALEVLEAGAISYIGAGTPKYAEVISIYLSQRKSGQTHAEAIVGLKGILNALSGN